MNNPHLTYCMNVHPGESLDDVIESIRRYVLPIRESVSPSQPFGLGLRLSNEASIELENRKVLDKFKQLVAQHDLYVFTINGFPYGNFHGSVVKENAYKPDWQTRERVDYTIRLANILATLLPESVSGSISTVPCSFGAWIKDSEQKEKIVHNLIDVVSALSDIHEKTGRQITLALEPEPDCFLENTSESVRFFTEDIHRAGERYLSEKTGYSRNRAAAIINRYLGICLDTCHLSLQFEDLTESMEKLAANGIKIVKVQLSAALKTNLNTNPEITLRKYCDPEYLHQVKAFDSKGNIVSRGDLESLLNNSIDKRIKDREWRIHCHIPLYFKGTDDIGTTVDDLTDDFFQAIRISKVNHIEIETYTFDVLPDEVKANDVVESVIREFEWMRKRLYR